MKTLKGILLIAGLSLLIYSSVTTCQWIKASREVQRQSENVRQMLSRKDFFLKMDKSEVNKYRSQVDSLIKAQNLRFNEVRTVDRIKYRNVIKIVPDTFLMFLRDTFFQSLVYVWNYDEDCFHLSGQVWDSLMIINKAEYEDSLWTIYYRKRPHKIWFIEYGKWQYNLTSGSACGETSTERIFFEK